MARNAAVIGLALIGSGVVTSLIGFGFIVGAPLILFGLLWFIIGNYTDYFARYVVID